MGIQTIPGYMTRGIVVNGHGQRFINEDVYPGLVGIEALYRQGMDVWVVLDEEAFEDVPEAERWGLQPPHVAETVAELEKGMGLPEGAAVGGDGAAVFTLGGLATDDEGRVRDRDGGPIAGPYAAGRASSGLHGGGYISGTSLGPGTCFGRRAGCAAAGAQQ
ncbi:hypothetical protein GCM10023353_03580 [Tomitella cavernea]|uniref:FAD-dependent oxidoreductase 2 FAD-binding domain-containing protein n=1 Tax=Tomitella cavernea TaxID=1387982 RepID=A0ABP9C6M4_9ACTN